MTDNDRPLFNIEPHTHARSDDPDTSHAAAVQLGDKTAMMRRLLAQYAVEPLTAEEAADRAGFETSGLHGAWKRVADLRNQGLLEDTDLRRPGRSGRLQIVRVITDAGMDAVYGTDVAS